MNEIWVVWREGYLGTWSLAHLENDNGETACGIRVPSFAQSEKSADGTFTHCCKCQQVFDAALDGPIVGELTDEQTGRQDVVDNAIRDMLSTLAGQGFEWDQQAIAAVREAAAKYVRAATGMSGIEYYPYLAEDGAAVGIVMYELDGDSIESAGFKSDNVTSEMLERIADAIAVPLWDRAYDLIADECEELGLERNDGEDSEEE